MWRQLLNGEWVLGASLPREGQGEGKQVLGFSVQHEAHEMHKQAA